MADAAGARRGPAPRPDAPARGLLRAILVGAAVSALLVAGLFLRGGRDGWPDASGTATPSAGASPAPSVRPGDDVARHLLAGVEPAPPLALFDPDGVPFSLDSLGGDMLLVFFGYTHCPDVCPATTGIIGEALRAYGAGARAMFVTVDPERDTPDWLRDYVRFLPRGFGVLTGTPGDIRSVADAWGVRYAKVDTGDPEAYTISHTADVFLVDGAGLLRASFPFGTEPGPIVATLRHVAATPAATSAPGSAPPNVPAATATASPSGPLALRPRVVSSSVWAGGASPVILALEGPAGRLNDPSARVTVMLQAADGSTVGSPVEAVAVRPPGIESVSFVATVDIPQPGSWRFGVTARAGAAPLVGVTGLVTALDPGAIPRFGAAAPTIATPTADDAGDIRRVTTDPVPDRRLSSESTAAALAAGRPYVLVLDSYRFKATAACGRALLVAKYLVDRWPGVAFIHHEPYRYDLITDTPVLQGSLTDPVLTDVAVAWGLDARPWGPLSMPWVFVVDAGGSVRAAFQGVLGSDDLDVMISLVAVGG